MTKRRVDIICSALRRESAAARSAPSARGARSGRVAGIIYAPAGWRRRRRRRPNEQTNGGTAAAAAASERTRGRSRAPPAPVTWPRLVAPLGRFWRVAPVERVGAARAPKRRATCAQAAPRRAAGRSAPITGAIHLRRVAAADDVSRQIPQTQSATLRPGAPAQSRPAASAAQPPARVGADGRQAARRPQAADLKLAQQELRREAERANWAPHD